MRYIFLALIFLWIYLSTHFYLSFFQNFSLPLKIFFTFLCSSAILLIISMHPLEFTTGIKFSGTVMSIMDFLLAVISTLFFIYLFTDILKILHIYPSSWFSGRTSEGLSFAVISLIICAAGYINAFVPVVMNYKIISDKNYKQDSLTIAAISDLHIGSASMTPEKLRKSIEKINAMKPDLVFILGDIFDGRGSYNTFIDNKYGDILKDLKSNYGTFAITGNHEYYMEETQPAISLLESAGIKVLQDDSVYVREINTYIIGRKDAASDLKGRERMSLRRIMKRPQFHESDSLFIVLDHNPKYINESRKVYADIQLSGHTHNGQLFPLNLIEKFIYETSWGLSKKGYTTLFVTSGLGIWGPAVRTSAVSEIAKITVTHSKNKGKI